MTKGCKNSPKIEKVDEEIFSKLLNFLLLKGENEWKKVITVLKRNYAEPYHKRAKAIQKEIEHLEEKIKILFQEHLQNRKADTELRLASYIQEYRKKAVMRDKLETLYFHLSTFLQKIDKETVLDQLHEQEFSLLQKQHLLSLVSTVYYRHSDSILTCYEGA